MRKTLATFVLLALTLLLGSVAQAQQPATKDATAQKPATPKRSKRAAGTTKKTAALLPVLGTMSESAGCTILNKGKHAQICYFDVTRLRPERTASMGPDVPIYISVRNHDTILWHSGGGNTLFHVIAIELRPKQNTNCPKQAFENEFKDDSNEPWHEVISSGLASPIAARYNCEYKTRIKWKDGTLGDPHIIIGDPDGP